MRYFSLFLLFIVFFNSLLGYWLLVIGYWLLVIGYWLLVIGYWLLVIGYWFLVIGYWLLVIGFWFLVISSSSFIFFFPFTGMPAIGNIEITVKSHIGYDSEFIADGIPIAGT